MWCQIFCFSFLQWEQRYSGILQYSLSILQFLLMIQWNNTNKNKQQNNSEGRVEQVIHLKYKYVTAVSVVISINQNLMLKPYQCYLSNTSESII